MSIQCHCDHDAEPGDMIHYAPDDYSTLKTSRRKRCNSCGTLIDVGGVCTKHSRALVASSDIEIAIYGEYGEVPRAAHYLCESCSDVYFSMVELGYCAFANGDDMRELAKEAARDAEIERDWQKKQRLKNASAEVQS